MFERLSEWCAYVARVVRLGMLAGVHVSSLVFHWLCVYLSLSASVELEHLPLFLFHN